MTRAAFENAMVVVMVTGGSTNAVLHLIAMARAVNVDLTIDDFQKVSDRIPYLCDLKPSGKYVFEDLHNIGGTPAFGGEAGSSASVSGTGTCSGEGVWIRRSRLRRPEACDAAVRPWFIAAVPTAMPR